MTPAAGALVDDVADQHADQPDQDDGDHHLEEQDLPPHVHVHALSEEAADNGAHQAKGEGQNPADGLSARNHQSPKRANDNASQDCGEDAYGAQE